MAKRIEWIDITKALAMFAIVLGHTLRSGPVQTYLITFHVPLFFFLSGLVFSTKKYTSFSSYLLAKVKTILVPYFAFGLVSVLIFLVFGRFAGDVLEQGIDSKWWEHFVALLYGNTRVFSLQANLPLWFLPCLFVVQMLYYPIDHYLLKKSYSPYIAAAGFALLAGLNYYVFHVFGFPFNMETAVLMSSFFALGMAFKRGKLFEKAKRFFYAETLCGVALVAAGAALGLYNGHMAYTWYEYGNFFFFLTAALCGCYGWLMICRNLPAYRALSYTGASTLAILVMHKFPILFFQTVVPGVSGLLKNNEVITGVLVSIVSMALCILAQEIIYKLYPPLLGRPANS